MKHFIDWFLHLDTNLTDLTQRAGGWIYGLLFLVIFCETGLVVTPFLPGDSLLFAVGALAAKGGLDIRLLAVLLTVAAILGDALNYHIGQYLGPRVLRGDGSRWLNRKHLARTEQFFEKYGARTVVLARFVPIVRTFAPFVAGIGSMRYSRFLVYNVIGALIWMCVFLGAGYFLGQIQFVKERFTLVVFGIIGVSVLPMLFELAKVRWQAVREQRSAALSQVEKSHR
jgi:membrane-associated protein